MIIEYLNQPAIMPIFHPAILGLLAAFAVLLAFCAWTDYRKGVLLPNWKYWLLPAIIAGAVMLFRLRWPETFGAAGLPDIIICLICILMYYITAWQRLLGGADFWGCSFVTIILCYGLGWPAFLIWVFISLIFIPFVCRTAARIKWCQHEAGAVTWDAWKKSNRGVKQSYRLLPAVWIGYVGALIVYLGAWLL